MSRFVAGDEALAFGKPWKVAERLVPFRGERLGRAGDHSLRDEVVRNDRRQEVVRVVRGLQRLDGAVERVVQRRRDDVEMGVRDRAHLAGGADPEHGLVDAEDRLHVPVLVRDLCREDELQVVVRSAQEKRRQDGRDLVLGMEAVGEDPHEGVAPLVLQGEEARPVPEKSSDWGDHWFRSQCS